MGEIDSFINLTEKLLNLIPNTLIGAVLATFLFIVFLLFLILFLYSAIKSGFKEIIKDLYFILNIIMGKDIYCRKMLIVLVGIVAVLLVLNPLRIDKNIEPFYPIPVDMKNVKKVGEWTYFIYYITESGISQTYTYPALFRYKENGNADRVSPRACYDYQVASRSVFYLDSTTMVKDHGELFVSRPDGKNERLLDEELYSFQIVDNQYIYYLYRHDTLGVGIDGHALYRMNLDGTNKLIAAYEVSSITFGGSHLEYVVKDGWVYGDNFRMRLGNPANGFEKIELISNKEDNKEKWIYYITNRLIKAHKDGGKQFELDGIDTYHYEINNIDKKWIYYTKGGVRYKITKNGTNKTRIN